MAAVSRPIMYLAVAALALVGIVYATGDPGPVKPPARPKRKATVADAGWDFPPPDPKLRFDKPKKPARNPFAPLVAPEAKALPVPKEKEDLVQVPAGLAGGEGGWAYTGMAEVDGVRMALLENGGTHQSGYVREGETWKKARVVAISLAAVVFADEKGLTQTVNRFNPNDPPKPKPETPAGFQPPLAGRIGNGSLQVRPLSPTPPSNLRPVRGARP